MENNSVNPNRNEAEDSMTQCVLGTVGGAGLGAISGGPVGAVFGAIAGAAASCGDI